MKKEKEGNKELLARKQIMEDKEKKKSENMRRNQTKSTFDTISNHQTTHLFVLSKRRD